jgi:unsaturated rhamnogalacturonyl hydrolase
MIKRKIFQTLVCIVFMFVEVCMVAQQLPPKEQVLGSMELTNKYFMEKWPDVGKRIVTNTSRASNIWTRGVYYEGLMALYKLKTDTQYLNYALRWADFHKWNLRDGNTYSRNADNQCAGQTYIDLYLLDPKPERIKNIKASVDSMLKTNKIDDWSWIDALQMGMPVFARLSVIYNDNRYLDRMNAMYLYTKLNHGGKGLFNRKDKLWWRDKDFVYPYKEPNGEDCYWSRGNGWVIAALVRVMDIIPKTSPYFKEYLTTYKHMIKALIPIQRKDGFWNVSLHDSTHFGGKETSGTALFVYGMAWGVNNGYLSAKKYNPIIAKAWNSMVNDAVHADGFLGYLQGTGKEPKDGQPVTYTSVPDFEDYGLGCFLLAGSEVYKMK